MSAPASPRISIVLPVFNGEEYLSAAIASLVAQSFSNFELLIVDDGSTDQSVSLIQSWIEKDKRIRLILNGEPHGLPHALNRGLQSARAEFIARADQDDLHRPDKLAAQVQFLEQHPKIMLLGTAYQPFTSSGSRQPIFHPTDPVHIAWKMLTRSAFCHPSVMFRRALLTQVGTYPIVASEDYAYFSRIVRHSPAANLKTIFIDYREHTTNYSKTRREAMAKSVQETFIHNVQDYLGVNTNPVPLYNFLVRRYLPLQQYYSVTVMCFSIAKKLRLRYNLASLHSSTIKLATNVLRELITVSVRTLVGLRPIGEPLP